MCGSGVSTPLSNTHTLPVKIICVLVSSEARLTKKIVDPLEGIPFFQGPLFFVL
jgi:hypothetical protein